MITRIIEATTPHVLVNSVPAMEQLFPNRRRIKLIIILLEMTSLELKRNIPHFDVKNETPSEIPNVPKQ